LRAVRGGLTWVESLVSGGQSSQAVAAVSGAAGDRGASAIATACIPRSSTARARVATVPGAVADAVVGSVTTEADEIAPVSAAGARVVPRRTGARDPGASLALDRRPDTPARRGEAPGWVAGAAPPGAALRAPGREREPARESITVGASGGSDALARPSAAAIVVPLAERR